MNTLPKWIKIGWILGRVAGWPLSWVRRRPCLLVIHSGSLGDALLFTGALRELRRRSPGKEIVLVVSERACPMFKRCPHVDVIIPLTFSTSSCHRVQRVFYAARVFARKFDAVFCQDVIPGEASAYFGWLVQARGRFLMEFGTMRMLSEPVLSRDSATLPHELDRMIHFLQEAGIEQVKSRQDMWPETYVTMAERDEAAQEFAAFRNQFPDGVVVTVCAGARFKQKDWGVANFTELIRRLAISRPVFAVLTGAAGDRPVTEAIEKDLQGESRVKVLNKAGQLELHESIALIEQSDICVGNDTFGLHAAIAVGTPSVVVMWGGDFERWAPWGDPNKHRMVRSKDQTCFGCHGECTQEEYRCMTEVTVDEVLKEVLSLPRRGTGQDRVFGQN